MKRVYVSQTELRSTDGRNQVVKLSLTPSAMPRSPLNGEQSDLLELQLTSQPCDTHQGFVRGQEQLMQRQSRTSGELLLPVSRRPSHREMASQRNNEAPSRISNRTSPWWFTRQTVAMLLCYWILTHTMP